MLEAAKSMLMTPTAWEGTLSEGPSVIIKKKILAQQAVDTGPCTLLAKPTDTVYRGRRVTLLGDWLAPYQALASTE